MCPDHRTLHCQNPNNSIVIVIMTSPADWPLSCFVAYRYSRAATGRWSAWTNGTARWIRYPKKYSGMPGASKSYCWTPITCANCLRYAWLMCNSYYFHNRVFTVNTNEPIPSYTHYVVPQHTDELLLDILNWKVLIIIK